MRAFVGFLIAASLPLAACVPGLPQSMLSGTGGGPPSGTAGLSGRGGSAGAGGLTGSGGAKADAGGTSPDACAGCTIYILVEDAGGQPRNIAVGSAGAVYWVDRGRNSLMTTATLATDPSPPPTPTLPSVHTPDSWIVVDADTLYWSDGTGSAPVSTLIMKNVAGQPHQIASDPAGIRQFAVANRAVYWINYANKVMTTDADGTTPPTLLASDVQATAIAVDRASVYWISNGSIMKVGISGGESAVLASVQNTSDILAVDGTYVYWVGAVRGYALMRVSIGGGTPEPVFPGTFATSVAADATGVYWTIASGEVLGAAPGGETRTVARSQYHSAFGLALDAGSVYWIAPNNTGLIVQTSIYKAPK